MTLYSPELSHLVDRLGSGAVYCLGDVMLDRFVYGAVARISPEAPVPVLMVGEESAMPGGAGNVLRNLTALGARVRFGAVIGGDAAGHRLTEMIGAMPQAEPALITEQGRPTTEKTRYIAGQQQLLRTDRETAAVIASASEDRLLHDLAARLSGCGALLLSDYAKGVLSDKVLEGAIAEAQAQDIPVIVDPKRRDWSAYRGAFLLSPNWKEFTQALGHVPASEEELEKEARALIGRYDLGALLVTRGPEGMVLVPREGAAHVIPARAREVFDVSGAGDTVIATVAAAVAAGIGPAEAAELATVAAGIVVGRLGTATVTRTEIKTGLLGAAQGSARDKILPLSSAKAQVAQWQAQGLSVGFTNGCFDLLHPGHLHLLGQAAGECDRLVVGLNSDESIRRLKGPSRPVQTEMDRATLLAALEKVDAVVIFREDTPLELLKALRPDLLVKGQDYTVEQVVGAELVASWGGRVFLATLLDDQGTTQTIAKIRQT